RARAYGRPWARRDTGAPRGRARRWSCRPASLLDPPADRVAERALHQRIGEDREVVEALEHERVAGRTKRVVGVPGVRDDLTETAIRRVERDRRGVRTLRERGEVDEPVVAGDASGQEIRHDRGGA